MARRVGFGTTPEPERRDGAEAAAGDGPAAVPAGPERPRRRGARVIPAAFITVFLIAWSVALFAAIRALLESKDEGATVMLALWVLFGLWMWRFLARLLLRAIRGQPLGRAKPGGQAPNPFPRHEDNVADGDAGDR